MKKIIIHILTILVGGNSFAQDIFLTKGTIEFEMKTNVKRMSSEWSRGKDKDMGFRMSDGPEFMVIKKQLVFNGDKMLYRTIEREGNWGMGGSVVFSDLKKGMSTFKGSIMMDEMVFEDSLKHMRWKIEDETRVIAGFKCRKAVGVMMDSVYVVAFYCPEIVPQGGPEIFSGLPGMILGLAIPRSYTTWFATKVQMDVDDKQLVAPSPPKKKQVASIAEARALYRDQLKSYLTKEVTDEKIDMQLKGLNMFGMFR